jgi:hypothetical protein
LIDSIESYVNKLEITVSLIYSQPVHGQIKALGYFKEFDTKHSFLIEHVDEPVDFLGKFERFWNLCRRSCTVLTHVTSDEAPEGAIPSIFGDEENLSDPTEERLLSHTFQTIRELMNALLEFYKQALLRVLGSLNFSHTAKSGIRTYYL